jgi:hypothetical protein
MKTIKEQAENMYPTLDRNVSLSLIEEYSGNEIQDI